MLDRVFQRTSISIFRVWSLEFLVWSLGFEVWGLGKLECLIVSHKMQSALRRRGSLDASGACAGGGMRSGFTTVAHVLVQDTGSKTAEHLSKIAHGEIDFLSTYTTTADEGETDS